MASPMKGMPLSEYGFHKGQAPSRMREEQRTRGWGSTT